MPESPPNLRWQSITCLLLSIIGLIGSIYLTISHFDTRFFVCPELGPCEKILTSNSSHFLGIPVPILGIAYFLPMTVLCLPVAWRAVDKRVHLARLLLSIVGIGMVIYLFAEELFVLQSLCVWCSIIHAIGFLLFAIIVTTSPALLASGGGGRLADAD
ncbi:MAG TPA: vitamin K epoxide reductase family protein [Acidimicrobiales bacterium]|nr:vitamin K epoxide reductase family protein [Acidimicrobiales bacterium]